MEEDNDFLKLPIEERCQHKLWKARVNGYEEATRIFRNQTDEKSPEFSKYLGLVKKFIIDNNAVAQEKGLAAVQAFVENAAVAGKTCGEVMTGIVTKCLGAPKTKTKELALEIVLMYIEIEKHEIVQEELIKGLENKSPKVVASCTLALREALHLFGMQVISIKPLVKVIPKLLEDRDKVVREEAKLLCVEVYRWIRDALKPQLQSLKPVQITELENDFEKVGNERPVPVRYLRSQQEAQAKLAQEAQCRDDEDEVDNDVPQEIDAYDIMEAVDILSKLPKDFYEQCEAKKWQERKEALETLLKLTTNVKLESGDYGELVRVLKKMVGKDTNVLVVSLAGKCLAGLALGLRKKFQPYACQCVPVILEKFKEKKQNVLQALREAIDAIYLTTTMEVILEDIQAALENKNPQVRMETTTFLGRCFANSPFPPNKKLLKPLCNSLVKTLNDTDSAVRDSSAEALGTALKVVGEKIMGPLFQEVDSLKMAKVKDCCEKAVVKVSVQTNSARSRPVPVKSTVEVSSGEPIKSSAVITKKTSSAPVLTTKSKVVSSKVTRKTASGVTTSTKKSSESQVSEFAERELSEEEVMCQVESLLPTEILNGIGSPNWKERLNAVEKFLEVVHQIDKALLPAQAFTRILARKPGFKENNFQILKLKFEILTYISENSPISHCTVECCLSDLVDKIGDPKTGASAGTALTALAEATSLEYISNEVLTLAFVQKNPRNQAEALIWLSNAIKEFGLKVQVKEVINKIKKAFSSTNPSVRTSALALLSTLYLYVGKSLRSFFDGEKPALLQQIDAELEKVRDSKPPLPVRGLGTKCSNTPVSTESTEAPSVNIADLVPRVDVSSHITSSLLTEIADKNWKVRDEAIQKLSSVISDAKFISPNLGELPTVLRSRLNDTNKNLAVQALSLCQAIGTALGPHSNKHIRTLAPGMLNALGDNKVNVRNAALACLNTWVEYCSVATLFEGEIISTALRTDNPYLRIELLGWCAEKLPDATSLPTAELNLCIPSLLACLEDRNNDVRKKAHDSLLPFMTHIGYEPMVRAANKLKPASKNTVMAHLEKIRPNLPERAISKPKSGIMKGVSSIAPSPPSPNTAGENLAVESAGVATGKGKLNRSASKSKLTLKAGGSTVPKGSKKEEEVDTSPPLVLNNLKDQRLNDERALKVLRWNFTSPREEFYLQLKEQMAAANWGRILVSNCFHNDFRLHLKAIDILNECLSSNLDATAANLDLILKWLALRFFDTNPSVLIRGLEYLQQLFEALMGSGYRLLEPEASSFVPYLILKMGDPKDAVRKGVREILKLICHIYPFTKIFSYVMQGLASKNARQRAECLEELGLMIETYGLSVYQQSPAVALREVAKQISDRDNSVRNAALNCFVQAYFLEGEKIYKYVGQLADKDMSLLEERIKRSSKGRVIGQRESQKEASVPSPQASRSPPSGNADNEVVHRTTPKGRIPRPRSTGPLTLEVDDIEHMFKHKEPEAKLPEPVEVNADEILNLPDIQLPQTRLRPPASAVKLLNNSAEANTALNLVMAQLTAQEIPVVVEAFAQIEEVLRQDDKAETVLGSRVDQLLVMGALQYRLAHNKHMADENICKAEVIRLYRCVTMALLSLFDHNTLAKRASRDVLRDLIPHLVTVMLDTRLNELQEGPQVVRAINILIVRILQRSNPTHVMSALIKLLHDCVGSMNTSERFIELVMKCLWKMLRMMGQYINDLNIDRILLDLHVFLKAYPSSSWRDRPSDTPIRTVKTILYTLVSYKGEDIMKHLMLIPNRQDSDLVSYLQKLLHVRKDGDKRISRGSSGISSKGQQGHDDNIPEAGNGSKKGKSSPLKLSKSTHEALTEIFRKIGSKEHTKEGLMELYEFKQRHPEANIEPFLQRSSEFFQNYISEGIKTIEQEKNAQEQHPLPCNVSSPQLLDANSKSDSRLTNQGSLEMTQTKDFEKNISSTWTQGLPPIPPYSEETTTMDWIEWLKIVVAHLGMDTTQYNDATFLQQLLSNTNIITDDNAAISEHEMSVIFKDVEKLQCMLENIKQQYKMNVK